jgi:hypothetical protein
MSLERWPPLPPLPKPGIAASAPTEAADDPTEADHHAVGVKMHRSAVLVCALTAVLLSSAVVGFYGGTQGHSGWLPSRDFAWGLAAVTGTALGTTLLALATFWLTTETTETLELTRSGLALQRKAVDGDREARELQIRPFLSEAPLAYAAESGEPLPTVIWSGLMTIEVDALRNSGNGPALVTSVVPRVIDPQGVWSFETTVLPGERFRFKVSLYDEQLGKQSEAVPECVYTDITDSDFDMNTLQEYSSPYRVLPIDIDYLDSAVNQPQRTPIVIIRDAGQEPILHRFVYSRGDPPKEWLRLVGSSLFGYPENRPWTEKP